MIRRDSTVRPHLDELAKKLGFNFHTIDGEVYWDESRYYQFTLKQIEEHLEDATNEINQMFLKLVDEVVQSDELLDKLEVPHNLRTWVKRSWKKQDKTLYGRMDFAYDGKNPPKLLEMNGQTPTSIYEAAYFQWVWLQEQVDAGKLPASTDQFNSIQEKLIDRFYAIYEDMEDKETVMYFASCKGSSEDKATVDYLRDCAHQAGLQTAFIYVDDIGLAFEPETCFTDLEHNIIRNLFMLYPWEHAFEDTYGKYLSLVDMHFFEPPWKVLLNKGILPLLWERYPNHPNLLPAYFVGEEKEDLGDHFVTKPVHSREGANITILDSGEVVEAVEGDYGNHTMVAQKFYSLPKFGDDYTLIGSWVIGDKACGLTIREDDTAVTKDTSRFVPHVIIG
ncbi:MAG: glutathionylspermidine synthase family protein [Aestuariibacter sp.]|nr:glutathionylspermidine synthase family protein [Aestuariibacter sp.]